MGEKRALLVAPEVQPGGMARELEAQGFRVTTSHDLEEASRALGRAGYTLALVHMESLDAPMHEVMGRLRQCSLSREISLGVWSSPPPTPNQDRQRTLGGLIQGVMQDLQTPLAVALNNLEHLERGLTPTEEGASEEESAGVVSLVDLRGMSHEALEAVQRLNEALNAVLVFADVQQQRRIDQLDQAVSTALHLLTEELRYRTQITRVRGSLPVLPLNEGELAQVMIHVLRAAARALPSERFHDNLLHVETWRRDGMLGVDVVASGPGLQPHLARLRYRAMCEQILEEYQGRLEVDSEQARVRFRVVLATEGDMEPPAQEQEQRPRVLLIDDDPRVCRAMKRLLGLRYDVTAVEHGISACALLQSGQQFDAILCDLYLGDMSGLDIYWWLSRELPRETPRFLFMSGATLSASMREALESTGRPLIYKLDYETLQDHMDAILLSHPRR